MHLRVTVVGKVFIASVSFDATNKMIRGSKLLMRCICFMNRLCISANHLTNSKSISLTNTVQVA